MGAASLHPPARGHTDTCCQDDVHVLTGALSLPFLARCGRRAKNKCSRFLAVSLGRRDVVNMSQQ